MDMQDKQRVASLDEQVIHVGFRMVKNLWQMASRWQCSVIALL